MALDLRNKVLEFLREHPEQKYTARQIAEWIFERFPEECQAKKNSSKFITSDAELIQQLVSEIASQRPQIQKKHPEIKTTGGRPRRYYYSEKSDSDEVDDAETGGASVFADAPTQKLTEHDLYPFLSHYLWSEFGIYSKRIDEKRSSNKRGPTAIAGYIPMLSAWRIWETIGIRSFVIVSSSTPTSARNSGHSR